ARRAIAAAIALMLASVSAASAQTCDNSKAGPDDVIAGCTRSISAGRSNTRALSALYNNRGLAFYFKRSYDRAIEDLDQAIRLAPRNHIAHANRGLAYRGKGDDNRALADYSRAIEIDRKYVYAFIARSRLYRDRRDFDKAIQDAEAALRLAP